MWCYFRPEPQSFLSLHLEAISLRNIIHCFDLFRYIHWHCHCHIDYFFSLASWHFFATLSLRFAPADFQPPAALLCAAFLRRRWCAAAYFQRFCAASFAAPPFDDAAARYWYWLPLYALRHAAYAGFTLKLCMLSGFLDTILIISLILIHYIITFSFSLFIATCQQIFSMSQP